MPQKPSKFGIKFWLLCDVMTSYVLKAIPYLGKEDCPNDVGVAEHEVMTLMELYLKTGLNVTSDNFVTLLKTAKKLLRTNITMVGTVWSNKKDIPSQFYDAPTLPLHSSRFSFPKDESIMMALHTAKDTTSELAHLFSTATSPMPSAKQGSCGYHF